MVTQQWPDPPDEPAALAGIKPVAWLNKKLPHMAILTKPDEGGGWFPVYSAATVERLVQERDELKELHRSAVIEAQKSFAREEVCLKEMARRDARENKPRMSPQLGWDELRRQLAAMTQERDDYRAALEYKSKREEALKARDLKCACDHNEYCSKCFPLDFREGGMFYETPDSVMRNALAKYPSKADELEGKK